VQVNSRSIGITTKINTGFTTPIHACYGDNSSAIAQVPTADLASYGIPCTIIELIWGVDNTNTSSCDGYAYATHYWGVSAAWNTNGGISSYLVDHTSAYTSCAPFTHQIIPGQIQDYSNSALSTSSFGVGGGSYYMLMGGESIFNGGDSASMYSIHRMGSIYSIMWNSVTNYVGNPYGRVTGVNFSPSNLDWYKWHGTAPANEAILIGPSNDFVTTISTLGTSSDTTINVASASGFPSAGWIHIDGEIIQYTGTTGSSFTGCTRARYSTVANNLMVGTKVSVCGFWVFFVAGLLFSGYAIPT
jgi:hypothetical protein